MSEEEEDPSSSDEASDEDYDEDEEIVDWDWARSLKPSKLKEDELKRLIHIFQTWNPPDIGEEVGMEKKVLLMYELSVGAFLSRESDLKDALEELQEKGGRGSEDKLREENKQLKSQVKKLIKKSKSGKNSDEAIEEILQLEQELSRYKHECDHLEREVDRERGGKEALETKVESLQKERKSLKKEINNLKDELVDSRRSVEDDEAEAQEVELKRVRELEESIRLKNKQIHQLLEDIELVEKDNENYQNNVVNLRDRLSEATNQINSLTGEYVSSKESVERLNTLVKDLESENSHLQTLLDDFHSDKIRRDENLESLGRKVDERFESLKDKLKERDAEIEELRARLNRIQLDEDQNVYAEGSENICAHGSGKMVRDNVAVLSQAIKEREEQIEALRRDLVQATSELDRYAKLIENLNLKKNKDRHGIDPLQKVVVDLQAELYEVNMRVSQLEEETNDAKEVAREKTEELSECITRLHSYEKGEFGLEQSIEEIKRLKKKLKNDEEQIRRLTSSCNHLQYSKSQLEEENTGYRDQLGLSPKQHSSIESSLIGVGSSSAESKKDTNKQIQQERALMQVMQREIERLEEERLLLKTENRKLARQLGSKSAEIGLTPEDLKNIQEYSDALRYRRRHMSPTDTGGSSMIESHKRMTNLENEVRDLKSTIQQKENDCSEVTMKYNDMLEENKELRKSMREILDSIQSQDADSNVKIESESLDRILSVLDARHLWGEYHPAMEMNTRIQRLEGCNQELRNQIKKSRKDEERFSIQISKYVSRIQELESHLISYKEDIKSRPLIEDQKESDHSVLEEYDVSSNQANTSIAPIQATDVSVKLNFQLIQVLDQLHEKEAFNKKLESEIESLHGKINVQRHQMGLLYEEHREKKNKWELEMKKMEVEHTEQADEMKKLLIKVEEYEKDLDNDQVRSETLKKIVILRSNEAMMVRRYRAMEDSEKLLREEVKKLKDDSFKMEIEIVRKLGSLQRYKEIASFKIEALQKSISKSVPIAELDSLNCQYSDLLLKYKELVQTNQTIAAQSQELNSDNEMPQQSLVQECNKLKNEVSLSQEKINSLEKVIESFNKSIKVGGSEEEFSANQYSKQISALEMREINERQRADCLDRQNKLLQSQISELGNRNNDLEIKFKEISNLYTELQKNERYLQDQILNNVTKEEYDELNDKLKKLELSEAKLNNERDELKEISDIATNQISVLENKKKNENIELESLRHQVIDLQTQTDEKSIIGKLHRQVILLQLRESEAAIKIKGMENQVRKSDLQLFRQSKKCEEYENIIFKTRLESNKKLKKMYKMIQDLRHRYTGSIIPLSKQESLLQNYLKIIEDKRKIGIALRKAEEERLESEILKEELRIKLNSETSSQSPQCKEESMNKFQELQLQEMKTRLRSDNLAREIEHLRKSNEIQSHQIERLETEVIRKESLFENKYFSEWDPVYNSLLIVESKDKESKGLDYNIKSPGHDEPLSTQLDSALQKIKKQSSILTSTNQDISDIKKQNEELMRKLRESEGLLSVKDKTITELRSRIPDTVDKLIAASTATGPSGFPLALSEDYESRQGLKIAQSTVECLRERLKQKEDILIRYELHIKSIRDESEKESRLKDDEIRSLQSRLRVQQSINNDLSSQIQVEGDDKNTFQLDLADKKIQDLEEEIGSLHRSIAESSDKLKHVLKDRDKYFALSEEFRRKLEELRDPSSSSEDISTLHRLNEEISHLQMELEHAHERENELLLEKNNMESKTKIFPSSKRLEIEDRDKKIRALSKVITDLKSEMVNLKRNDSHEQSVFDEKHRQINDLTDKNEKLNRTIKTLRDKDANQAKEIQRIKDENYELQNAEKSSTKPSGMSNIIKDRDSLRLKVRRLEQRLETINRPERPLEESSEDNGEEDAIEKRIKNAGELARWNESKKWQSKIETFKSKVSDGETEITKLNRINKSMKDTISRLERDSTIMRSKMKSMQDKSMSYDVKILDLTELNEKLIKENDLLRVSGPVNEPLETLKLKNKFLNERIGSQEVKIAALELTKNKSNAEKDFISKLSEIQDKERLCQKEKLELEERMLNLMSKCEQMNERKQLEMKGWITFLEELKIFIVQEDKDDIVTRIEDHLMEYNDLKVEKTFNSSRLQTRKKNKSNEELQKLKNMNENLISRIETKNTEMSRLEEEVSKLQRLLKRTKSENGDSNKSDDEPPTNPVAHTENQRGMIELPREKYKEMEFDLKRKSDLLNEVKVLLKQAATRERAQTSESEDLKKKVELLTQVDPKSPSHILAKELRLSKLTIERLESEKKELEHQIEVLTRKI